MKVATVLRRFFFFPLVVTVYCLIKYRAKVSHRAEVEVSRNLVLARGVTIGSFTKVKASEGTLRMGANTRISNGCFVAADEAGLEIGENCLIGPGATIVSNAYHTDRIDIPFLEQGTHSKGTRLGDNVFIGAGARILDGAVIGSGAMIAANSVVATEIPENAIAQGAPAKVVLIRK